MTFLAWAWANFVRVQEDDWLCRFWSGVELFRSGRQEQGDLRELIVCEVRNAQGSIETPRLSAEGVFDDEIEASSP